MPSAQQQPRKIDEVALSSKAALREDDKSEGNYDEQQDSRQRSGRHTVRDADTCADVGHDITVWHIT